MTHLLLEWCAITIFPPSKFKKIRKKNKKKYPMAHQYGIVMAHIWCAITITGSNGAPNVRHYYRLLMAW